ncbi:hypothetical protein SPF06_21535 [Sinomonas sp. JGH33]|uniref:ADP ribosyltransferase domain-containing protein n=1 Tax=Sinomonas terricola TaxID=3110330 RepID=A0ABU5TC93_9MICC|nr:hypothetical protein [Sinomonas sp. JGH33]MEA5457308.1 hypothetical protein [Sinomonas sp. JGH33]
MRHFSAAACTAFRASRRPLTWKRDSRKEAVSSFQFALAARDLAAVAAFSLERPAARGFPSYTSYRAFTTENLGLASSVLAHTYYEIQAVLAGYPSGYRLRPDRAAIAMLEQHRDTIAPTVPDAIAHIVDRHTGEQDYNSPAIVRPEQAAQLAAWISGHGLLPHPVAAYRQESAAWATSTDAQNWFDRLARLVPGDELSWDNRPVSTSLDPGYTRLMAYGWGDDAEWTPQQRHVHFAITASRGYYVGSATRMPHDEHELILAPGQRYRVTGIRQHTTGDMLGRSYGGRSNRLYIVLDEIHG